MEKKTRDFLIALAVGAGLTLAAVLVGFLDQNRTVLQVLCDGFTVSGVLLLCFSGLVWSRNQGTFDMISFGVSRITKFRYGKLDDEERKESFYDYRQRKSATRQNATASLKAGAVYMALALVFLLLFFLIG